MELSLPVKGRELTSQMATRSVSGQGTSQWGRGTLIVESFSWADVERMLVRLLAQASGETWQEVAQTLNKELRWEFEGYRPD
jgi:hypothetical protein